MGPGLASRVDLGLMIEVHDPLSVDADAYLAVPLSSEPVGQIADGAAERALYRGDLNLGQCMKIAGHSRGVFLDVFARMTASLQIGSQLH